MDRYWSPLTIDTSITKGLRGYEIMTSYVTCEVECWVSTTSPPPSWYKHFLFQFWIKKLRNVEKKSRLSKLKFFTSLLWNQDCLRLWRLHVTRLMLLLFTRHIHGNTCRLRVIPIVWVVNHDRSDSAPITFVPFVPDGVYFFQNFHISSSTCQWQICSTK